MARKQAAATEHAVKAYYKGADVYALADRYGITPSTLYRALKDLGFKFNRAKANARGA